MLKARQRDAWACGDYAIVGTTLQIVAEQLCEAIDLRAGERVLDVAAGNGAASLAAARRFGSVMSTDYVASLLERGRERAAAERLPIEFQLADAEALPFADRSFDVVLSTFGVMFTADHEAAARELLRVCRTGGRIGLANWTPDGFIGQLFARIGKHLPPPPGARAPAQWGTVERLRQLFGASAQIAVTPRDYVFRYRSPQHWIDVFRSVYGPMVKAFAALQPAAQARLEQDLHELVAACRRPGEATMVVPSAYLEVVITVQ